MAEIRPDLSDETSRGGARPTARVESDPALICVHCNEHIDTSGNYDALLPAHIRCWYANLPTWSPVSRDPGDPSTRVFRQQISMVGYAVLPLESFRGEHDHGTWTMEDPKCTATWDLPGSLYWVKVARTPCVVEDLGLPEPQPEEPFMAAPRWHRCRYKHAHNGPRACAGVGDRT